MRVLIVSQYYPPEPFEQIADFVARLRAAGHEVTVLTSFPCYPKGKIFDGFKQTLGYRRDENGTMVHRVVQYPDHSRSALRRIFFYVSFLCTAIIRAALSRPKCDVVLAYQTSITVGLAGRVIAWLLRKKVVFFVLDLWPESVTATEMIRNRVLLRLLKAACSWIYRSADVNACITEGYIARLEDMGVARNRLRLVRYWAPDAAGGGCAEVGRWNAANPFRIVYAGNIGPAQGLDAILDAAETLQGAGERVEFILAGDGLDLSRLSERAEKCCLQNVKFLGRRPLTEMPALHSGADALLVHLKPDVLSRVSIPSKTVSYLCFGKPLVMAVEGECTRLVERTGCGVVATPSSGPSLVGAVRRLLAAPDDERAAMGRRARALWEEEFNPNVLAPRLMALLESCSHCTPQKSKGV